jgi:hypothetical protein
MHAQGTPRSGTSKIGIVRISKHPVQFVLLIYLLNFREAANWLTLNAIY